MPQFNMLLPSMKNGIFVLCNNRHVITKHYCCSLFTQKNFENSFEPNSFTRHTYDENIFGFT